jgi:hypothetical protein
MSKVKDRSPGRRRQERPLTPAQEAGVQNRLTAARYEGRHEALTETNDRSVGYAVTLNAKLGKVVEDLMAIIRGNTPTPRE